MAAGLLACALPSRGQNIAPPPGPETPLMSPAVGPTQYEQNQARVFGQTATNEELDTPFQLGPVAFTPFGSYEISYGTGIQAQPGVSSTTVIQSISPGGLFALGKVWSLNYTPTWQLYSNKAFHDTLDQSATLTANDNYADWNLQFSQSYSRTNEPLVETGRQTPEQDYATGFQASYGATDQIRLSVGLNQDILFASDAPDSYDWSTTEQIHYLVIPQLDAYIGPGFGYVIEDPGFDMNYIQAQAGLTWTATDKLDLNLQGGFEHRDILAADGGTVNTSLFSATIDYKPSDTTTLTVTGSRSVEPSLATDQIDQNLNFNFSVQQRLLGHFYMGAKVGYETDTYLAIGPDVANVRNDQFTTYGLNLNTTLFRKCTISLQYQNNRNLSSVAGFGLSSYQYGLTLGYRY
jgi:hypothetical protein